MDSKMREQKLLGQLFTRSILGTLKDSNIISAAYSQQHAKG